jgi:predicted P-loop ATPase
MTRAKKVRRAKRRPEKARAPAGPLPDQDTNAASSALLALEEGRGAADVEPEGDGSVEDPLQDWPEQEGEPDRWLEERSGPDVEKVPDE